MVAFEKAPPEAKQLLTVPIRELGLSLERSPIAPFVRELYAELYAAGLHRFRPRCYLSDEWGCPSEEPVIGIPFYLGDSRVARLEDAVNDVENEREIMMYIRHEAGHAFNYAYELFRGDEWHELFGSFRRPYRDDFPFVPFSKDYVRHIAGWYAQKHPDEDFAETFAVWLDPESNWRERYRGWGAMKKLLYVDRELGDVRLNRLDHFPRPSFTTTSYSLFVTGWIDSREPFFVTTMFSSPLVDFSVSSGTMCGKVSTWRSSTIDQVGSFSGTASRLTSASPVTPEGSALEA